MQRQKIEINQDLCVGCGLCVNACHQGAIELVNGKAQLMHEDYCDGLGRCLPGCPTGAITLHPAEPVKSEKQPLKATAQGLSPVLPMAEQQPAQPIAGSCPGMQAKAMKPRKEEPVAGEELSGTPSALAQWPVQIRLVPVNAPYFENAHLLVAADCAAYAMGDFHPRFMQGKVTVIGCPKLDEVEYAQKLGDILRGNTIRSVTVARMEVPCCAGLANAAIQAVKASTKQIDLRVAVLSVEGELLREELIV